MSVQPAPARKPAVVLDSVGAAAAPSNRFGLPKPTRSRIRASCSGLQGAGVPEEEPQARAEALSTRATLPLVPDRFTPVFEASGVGSAEPLAPPARLTRKYWPGCTVTAGSGATPLKLPVLLAYCTDLPDSDTACAPRLKSST